MNWWYLRDEGHLVIIICNFEVKEIFTGGAEELALIARHNVQQFAFGRFPFTAMQ